MRVPTYLSYSSLSLFEKNIEEYYMKHLSETRAPRMPQERPASIGSAFDARVKASLYKELQLGDDPRYTLDALFETQVEEHNRDWAWIESEYVFDSYKIAGQYDTLLDLLRRSIEPPRFEFDVRGPILGVPFLAKPDCRYVLPGPIHVIHDWKVNGYCAKSATSPTKGYMICNDGYRAVKQSKSHATAHKNFKPFRLECVNPCVNVTGNEFIIDEGYLEDSSTQWADQLSLYGWSLGEEVGDQKVVLSIDQIVAKPLPEGRPLLRVASFRARVRKSYQEFLAKRLTQAWEVITSGHIFRDLTPEESKIRCEMLDGQAIALQSDGSVESDWFNEVVRPVYRG